MVSRTFASLTPPLRFACGPPAFVPRVARSSMTIVSLLAVRKRDCMFLCCRLSGGLFGKQGVDPAGELDGIAGLAGCRRTQNAYQVDFSGEIFVEDFPDIYVFCRREFRHGRYGSEWFLCHKYVM